ncbi:pantoate--beta-alanine ligase [Gracilibacillus marinus]|uniref:Pantothenate synthetase n=1 Tax=Gracilibacillus marinus TaxID=630535 RepID=A0ABV8VT43_9BACI
MKVIRTVEGLTRIIKEKKQLNRTIGFVPTMGYLHEGHVTLMDQCRKETDVVVVSIFVNPLQFGPNEDFERYPRDEERDAHLALSHGADILFLPSMEEMYPSTRSIEMTVVKRNDVLCGRSRQGHFDGVVTVLTKLFHLTQADVAYFGLKDAQQVAIVKGLIDDYNFPIKIRTIQTVRESDGLAKSSRNVYLTEEERNQATNIYKSLLLAQNSISEGNKNIDQIKEKMIGWIKQNTSATIDYIEILDYPSLEQIETINKRTIIAIAVHFTNVRLIDNVIVNENGDIIEKVFS